MASAEFFAIDLFRDIGVIIVMATLFNLVLRRLGQPSFLAYILAGVFIGPVMGHFTDACLGLEAGSACLGLPLHILGVKNPVTDPNIALLSELGVAFLLFSVGVETKIARLRNMGGLFVAGGTLQVLVVAGTIFALSFFTGLLNFNEAVYLGSILAFSSTMVVVKLLSDRFEIDTLHGRLMIGFLLMQDFLIVVFIPLLARLDVLASAAAMADVVLASLLLLGAAVLANRVVFPRLFNFSSRNPELLFLSGVSSAFVFMAFSKIYLDLPIALGAFVGGLALSNLPYNMQIYDEIRGVRDFFLTIFFVTLGMQLAPPLSAASLPLLALMALGVFVLKPLLFLAFTLAAGFGARTGLFVGLGLAQVSEFSFILASQGLESGIISPEFYSLTVLGVAVSMVVTTYIFKFSDRVHAFANWARAHGAGAFLHRRLYRRLEPLRESKPVSDHIVIIGGGMVGGAMARALAPDHALVVVDHDPAVVERLTRQGVNALFGQTDNRLVWEKLNVKNARLVIVAVPFSEAALRFIDHVRARNPRVPVFARAHTFAQARELYRHGASYVCILSVVGANLFLKTVSSYLESGKLDPLVPLQDEYMRYLREHAGHEERLPARNLYGDGLDR